MKRITSVFFIILLMLMVACQSNPEASDIIVENDKTEEESNLMYFKKEVPLYDNIALIFDANILIPENALAVAKIRRYPFSQDLIESIAAVLLDDAEVYEYTETQQELEDYLIITRAQLNANRDKLDDYAVKNVEYVLSDIEQALSSKPVFENKSSISKILQVEDGLLEVDLGRNKKATFQVLNDTRHIVRLSNEGLEINSYGTDVPKLNLSEEEAIQKASGIMKELGLVDEFALAQVYRKTMDYTVLDSYMNNDTKHQFIGVTFTRKINGVPQSYSDQMRYGTWKNEFDSITWFELIDIQFDDKGLNYFNWEEPGNVEIQESNVKTISLETAIDQAIAFLKSSNTTQTYEVIDPDNFSSDRVRIVIDKIQLTMASICDPSGDVIAKPIWDFMGNVEYTFADGSKVYTDLDIVSIAEEKSEATSICTIDATSGKRIDRGLGY